MPQESRPKKEQPLDTPEIIPLEFSGGSDLSVNGEMLTPKDGIELFERALAEGHDYILSAIDRQFQESKQRFPGYNDILPPSVSVMLLGKCPAKVNRPFRFFTEEAYFRGSNPYTDPEILREEFRPFWRAVEEAGFKAQAFDRRNDWGVGEIILMARLPDVPEPGQNYDPE